MTLEDTKKLDFGQAFQSKQQVHKFLLEFCRAWQEKEGFNDLIFPLDENDKKGMKKLFDFLSLKVYKNFSENGEAKIKELIKNDLESRYKAAGKDVKIKKKEQIRKERPGTFGTIIDEVEVEKEIVNPEFERELDSELKKGKEYNYSCFKKKFSFIEE